MQLTLAWYDWLAFLTQKSPESHKHKMNYMSYAPNPTSTPFAVDSAKREKKSSDEFQGIQSRSKLFFVTRDNWSGTIPV